jgi:hypothetical protein
MKLNILRGKLLALLKELYPDGMEEMAIIAIEHEYYKPDDVRASLSYLTDKTYILKKQTSHPLKPGEMIVGYKIAPSGIDLIDGNIPTDPGITLSFGA